MRSLKSFYSLNSLVAAMLIFSIIFHLSCATIPPSINKSSIIYKCSAKYLAGNSSVTPGEKGWLFLVDDTLLFFSNLNEKVDIVVNLDYIKSYGSKSERKTTIPRKTGPFKRVWTGESPFSTNIWADILLPLLTIIGVYLLASIIIEQLKDYVEWTVYYEEKSKTQWATFKIEEKSSKKINEFLRNKIKF